MFNSSLVGFSLIHPPPSVNLCETWTVVVLFASSPTISLLSFYLVFLFHFPPRSTVVRSASLLGSAHAGRLLSSSPSNEADSVGVRSRRLLLRYCAMRAIPIAAQAGLVAMWGTERYEQGNFKTNVRVGSFCWEICRFMEFFVVEGWVLLYICPILNLSKETSLKKS